MRVRQRIKMLHNRGHTLRVVAEKISCFHRDEWRSLHLVVETLYADGVRWSESQLRRAVKYCYDPRYYYRESIRELYHKAGHRIDYLPRCPARWHGITEWVHSRKKLRRLSSDDLQAGHGELNGVAYQFLRGRRC